MQPPVPLPPSQIRQGGGPLRFDDDYFVDTARTDVQLLTGVGLGSGMRLVDFGCGPGRIAIGLIISDWSGRYLGVEVKERHVRWASAEITSRYPDFQFVRVNAANARYNPSGSEPPRLPVDDGSADMICAFSVFSHMLSDDTTIYLREFRRALAPDGSAFITVFMADGVPDMTENPPWLGASSGRLHRVLYSTDFLSQLIRGSGLIIEDILPEVPHRKQPGLLLRPL